MKKYVGRLISLVLILMLLCGTMAGCGQLIKPQNDQTEKENNTESEITGVSEAELSWLVGNVVTLDESVGVLDEPETVSMMIPSDITEADYDWLFGVHVSENGVYYVEPDPEALGRGYIEFDIIHHSKVYIARPDADTCKEMWAKKAATAIVTKGIVRSSAEQTLGEIVDEAMEKLGLDKDSYGGVITRYILSQDTKGEILTAMVDGNTETLCAKLSSYTAEYLCGKFGVQGAGNIVDIAAAGSSSDNENVAQATVAISKEILKKAFPVIDVTSKVADLTTSMADVWANSSIDEAYELIYKKKVDANGKIIDSEWDVLYVSVSGASRWLQTKGIDEEALRERFEQRYLNEKKIAEKQKELEKLIDSFIEDELLKRGSYGFSYSMSLTDRLNSLYSAREMLREMFTENGQLKKGDLYLKTDNEFLNYVLSQWMLYGTTERYKFYEWAREVGILEKPVVKENYAWVLVDTIVDVNQSVGSEFWPDTFSGSAGSHQCTHKYSDKGKIKMNTSFSATCSNPPKIINDGDTVKLTINMSCSGSCSVKDEIYWPASEWAWIRWEEPGIAPGYTKGGPKFKDANGNDEFAVIVEVDENLSAEVSMKITAGSEGQREAIYFVALGSQTQWVYEWKAVK